MISSRTIGTQQVLAILLATALAGCGSSEETARPAPESPSDRQQSAPQEEESTSPTTPSDPDPSIAERDLTRIVAISWRHGGRVPEVPSLPLLFPEGDERSVPGLAVAFGGEAAEDREVLERGSDHDVRADLLGPNVFRVSSGQNTAGVSLERRVRVLPDRIVPLAEIELGPDGRVVRARVADAGSRAKGAAFLFPTSALRALEASAPTTLQVEIRGDLLTDVQGRAIDAEHVRGELPTGDRPAGRKAGVQGGTFKSWLTLEGN
jgi:hypothetical protein